MAKANEEVKRISKSVRSRMEGKNKGFISSYILSDKLGVFNLLLSPTIGLSVLILMFKINDYHLSIPLSGLACIFFVVFRVQLNQIFCVREMVYNKLKKGV